MQVTDRRDGTSHFLMWTDELAKVLDEVEQRYRCDHVEQEVRQFATSNGGSQIRHQCLQCGTKTSNAISRAKISGEVPTGDEALFLNWENRRKREREDVVQRYLERHLDRETQQRKQYDAYMASPQWKAIRAKVLKRSNGICEGCLDQKATQVHHRTYDNLGAEFLFELVAVCDDCHDRIHKIGDYASDQMPGAEDVSDDEDDPDYNDETEYLDQDIQF